MKQTYLLKKIMICKHLNSSKRLTCTSLVTVARVSATVARVLATVARIGAIADRVRARLTHEVGRVGV